jgi:peptidyl-prolyl cis-trans isomerase SurA
MIDERLEEADAEKRRITVSSEEVDGAIRHVAASAQMTPADILAEVRLQGMSEQDYRDEMRRQVLEGKLIQLRVRGRVRVTEQDARAAYQRAVQETQQQSPVDFRAIVLPILPGSSAESGAARMALATELSRRGRAGEDFCDLVFNYSQDPTKDTCGTRGPVAFSALFPALQETVRSLKEGEVSSPIRFQDYGGNQAILVVQLVQAPSTAVPPFDQVREQMMDRAFLEATSRQRVLWLEELRRGVYIDIRL